MIDYTRKHYMRLGERVKIEIGYSEAAMHLQVAGKVLEVELLPGPYSPSAQLYFNGKPFSFPITTGEAGIFNDHKGY